MAAGENAGFADALYFSLVSLATLGYGDIVPKHEWLRILAPAQALVGFGLLSAGITWLMSLYPALSSMRSFAHFADLVRRTTAARPSLGGLEAGSQSHILVEFASRVTSLRSQLEQFPLIYYFHNSSREHALHLCLPWLFEMSLQLSADNVAPETRFAATVLRNAIADLAAVLGRSFLDLPDACPEEILKAYARDHLATAV